MSFRPVEPFKALHPLIRKWAIDVVDGYELPGSGCIDRDPDDVSNKAYDGFIPWTDGGIDFVIPAYLGYVEDGSAPSMIEPYIDSARRDCQEAWDEENPEHTYEWIYASDDGAQGELLERSRERERWREKFWDFEHEWMMEGGTFFYKIRALYHGIEHSSESSVPDVHFMVGVNTDFEYGRDNIPWLRCYGSNPQQTYWVWEAMVKADQIDEALLEQLSTAARDALAAA